MAHEIFKDRFYGHRVPAWHGLGIVNEVEQSARETLAMLKPWNVELFRLGALSPALELVPDDEITGTNLEWLSKRVIMRHPTEDDQQYRSFGVVSKSYDLITPQSAARLWDEYAGLPIDSAGALYHGACLFLAAKLPSYMVAGDDVDNHLVYCNWTHENRAATIMVTPTRVVCRNTMVIGESSAQSKFRGTHHRAGLAASIGEWLTGAVDAANGIIEQQREAFSVMASRRVNDEQVREYLKNTYKLQHIPRNANEETRARVDDINGRITITREAAMSLFRGDGVGSDSPAAAGTVWGAYQAVVETENFRPGRYARSAALVGDRATTIQRAYTLAMEITRN